MFPLCQTVNVHLAVSTEGLRSGHRREHLKNTPLLSLSLSQSNSIQFNSRSYLLRAEHDKLTENVFSHGLKKKKKEIIKTSERKKKGHKRKHYFMK